MSTPPARPPPSRAAALGELAALFLRLGTTAFGGPAAHVALMEHEVVRRRGWVSRAEFLDLVAATNLIPGPNSTELAIHLGLRRAGLLGLLVAGACFVTPAALITAGLAWAYVRFGTRPEASSLFYGIKPVIIAIVLSALAGFARTAMKTRLLAFVVAGSLAASLAGAPELVILFVSAMLLFVYTWIRRGSPRGPAALVPPLPLLAAPAAAATSFGLAPLFFVFLKIGSILFGSGYVLLAFLRADLVERLGWLTEAQLLDAVAAGQITPGPVFTTATFIGFVLGGGAGAAVATVGIFLPAFVFVALSGPLVPRLRRSPLAGALLDGVVAASLGLMAAVSVQLARAALVDATTVLLALAAFALLVRTRLNPTWLVAAGAAVGLVARALAR